MRINKVAAEYLRDEIGIFFRFYPSSWQTRKNAFLVTLVIIVLKKNNNDYFTNNNEHHINTEHNNISNTTVLHQHVMPLDVDEAGDE